MRHMVPFYKKTAFPRGWEGWCWWPGCAGERVWGGSRGGHLPTSSVPGQALGSTAQEEPCTHPWRFSVSVGSAPGLLVGFNPQPPCSKEASGARAPSVAAAACPGQGPAPAKGFVPLGMGVSQALALWRLQLLWLQPQCCQGQWCGRPGVQSPAWQCAAAWEEPLPEHRVEMHPHFLILSRENSFTYDLAAGKGMGQLPFA